MVEFAMDGEKSKTAMLAFRVESTCLTGALGEDGGDMRDKTLIWCKKALHLLFFWESVHGIWKDGLLLIFRKRMLSPSPSIDPKKSSFQLAKLVMDRKSILLQ